MTEQPGVTLVPLGAPRGRRAWTLKHNGRNYAVFDLDGELQVTDAACPHNGGPLARGLVRDGIVTCPLHWYRFELRTGECRTAAALRLRTYRVVSQGGRAYAELPDEVRRPSWFRSLLPRWRLSRPGKPPN